VSENVIVVRAKGARGSSGAQGVQGIQGLTGSGVQGVQGIQGAAGTLVFNVALVSFTYEKQSNSTTWNITHNLGFRPNVIVMDYGQNNIECDIAHIDENRLTLTFSEAISGYAYLS